MIRLFSLALLLTFLVFQPVITSQAQTSGQLDPGFDPVLNEFIPSVNQAIVQPDGKILISGIFRSVGGVQRGGIARLNADGTLDTGFNPQYDISTLLNSPRIFLQPDGKILVASGTNGALIRLNADGSRDLNFSASTSAQYALVQPDGKIIVAAGPNSTVNLIRLNPDGSTDSSFNASASSAHPRLPVGIEAMDLEPDGDVLIAGGFVSVNGVQRFGLARLSPTGTVDLSFNPGVDARGQVKVLADGKILIAGSFSTIQNVTRKGIARLNPDGSLDASYVPATNNASGSFTDVRFVLQPDGKAIISGSFDLGSTRGIARLNVDGSLDPTFVAPAEIGSGIRYNSGFVAAAQPDGKAILVGSFKTINDQRHENVTRLNQDGSLDNSFQVRDVVFFLLATGARVSAIHVQADGKIVIGGSFTSANNYTYLGITRLNPNSTTDPTFNILGATNGPVNNSGNFDPRVTEIAAQADGKLLIGGFFTEINSLERRGLARLNADGTLDNTFVANLSEIRELRKILVEPDGKIIVAGVFTAVNGVARTNIARLNPDGSVDQTFNVTFQVFPDSVYDVVRQSDGKYLVAGNFTSVNGESRRGFVRLNNNGTVDTAFNPVLGGNGVVNALILLPDGKIIIGGFFSSVNGALRSNFVRLNSNGTLDESFNPPGNGGVNKLLRQPDGRIVVAGAQNILSPAFLYRVNADGSQDTSFSISGNVTFVDDLALQADGKLLVGGSFNVIGGAARRGIARFFNSLIATTRPAFDFNGDGRADIAVFRPSSGYWYISRGSNTQFDAAQFGSSSDLIAPADYDGDGRTDLAVFRPTGVGDPNRAYFYMMQSSNNAFRFEQFGRQGDVPVSGDWDGDGKADVAVYRDGNQAGGLSYFFYRPSSQPGTDFRAFQWGASGDKPVQADYDGDGKSDAAVFRSATQHWYIFRSSDSQVMDVVFGLSTDIPVPMDYDGDGRANLAVFRPSTGWWYRSTNPATNYDGIQFGATGDVPVAADYDGDGRADVAVFRPSNGSWYIQRTSAGFMGQQFGSTGDKPAPSAYVPF